MSVKIKGEPLEQPSSGTDYMEHLQMASGIGTVISKKTHKGQVIAESAVEHKVAEGVSSKGKLAEICVAGGRTINLGNYESARIDVGLRLPCAMSDIDSAYEFAQEWVNKRLEEATK